MKYTILVVDDELSGRTILKILLEKLFKPYIDVLAFAKTFEDAKNKLQLNKYDIVFFDINLKGDSAFNLLSFVPTTASVVFVTAYSEFMIQALRNKAFDYLIKPIKEDELKECLLRFQNFNKDIIQSIINIKHRGITRGLKTSNITYIQGDGPYSTFYLIDEQCTIARTLKSLTPELGEGFVRIHKTYIVNRRFIKGYNRDTVILLNNKNLPLSRTGSKNI